MNSEKKERSKHYLYGKGNSVVQEFKNLAPPVLSDFVKKAISRNTRALDRGDCIISCRKNTLGPSSFTYQVVHTSG